MPQFLTKKGLNDLQNELKKIVDIDLPTTLISLNTAREDGDLRENAAYQTAMKVKDDLTTRQQEIEEILKNYEIIIEEDSNSKNKSTIVQLGTNLTVEYLDTKAVFSFQIVGSSESDILENKISNDSPIAEALIGRKAGDTVSFRSPSGKLSVKIIEIN